MKIGKISESVLKRSVLKQIKSMNENVVIGAGVGEDCAIFTSFGTYYAQAVQTHFLENAIEAAFPIFRAAGSVATLGATPVAVTLTVLLPEDTKEAYLQELMQSADAAAASLQIQIAGGHTEVSASVQEPFVTACAVGVLADKPSAKKAAVGEDIVLTKWAGLEGTVLLANRYRKELAKRYPIHMIEKAAGFMGELSVAKDAAALQKYEFGSVHDVSGGGIFAALWEIAQKANVGLTADLKKIPIKQETVEICEFFGINPYEMLSGGSLLITAADGAKLSEQLNAEGIPATVIGRITDNNDRVVINDDERRFLERPGNEEIVKIKAEKRISEKE